MRYIGTMSGYIYSPTKASKLEVFWRVLGKQTGLGNVIIIDKLNRWEMY